MSRQATANGQHAVRGSVADLARLFERLDGHGYGAYRELVGEWRMPFGTLAFLRVQPDPFAPPSRIRLAVDSRFLDLPADLCATPDRRRAVADLLARRAAAAAPSPVRIDAGGQEILERTACSLRPDGSAVLRIGLALPGRGRRVDGAGARRLVCERLAGVVAGLRYSAIGSDVFARHVACVEDACALRALLREHRWVTFLADGSLLARRSGIDERPDPAAKPLAAPPELAAEVELPHRGRVRGLALGEGLTVLVGGGYHGKSTLLRAVAAGVYDHVPGDGRELCVTRPDAVHVRAEDGRAVTRVDIGAFIGDLPTGTSGRDFTTRSASGSTSQAAAICEALEAGSRLLLIDEDTSATNLLIRDERMQRLVPKEIEPITPLVDLVPQLAREHGVSLVLVSGGSGDYLAVADRVILMERFEPRGVTARAHAIAARHGGRRSEADTFGPIRTRLVDQVASPRRGRSGAADWRVRARSRSEVEVGDSAIDLAAVTQLVDRSQTAAVGAALRWLCEVELARGARPLPALLDAVEAELAGGALARWAERLHLDLARPRRYEVAAAINRSRCLRVAGFAAP
ncbi:ABC-ATPase domain-containing protein [Thermoleophilum album]|jgi:predicted ABC-class ATPase|uniref:ABC-ATPase domain-containing protein n=1 Tax=Thermoleophilum album TaxID=29539 RepID=UPI00237C84B5|nr:ABC-ATPase domain-containing protein [Thermoleophilum album]WDT94593.1 ABC-ATPase domain-containing protein [Thermoleophilum album]